MKNKPKIQTRSFIHMDGKLVELRTLPPEKKEQVATALALEYFNAMFAGRAVFQVAGDAAK